MVISSIDTVAIVVSDKRKALKWYSEILGLSVWFIGPAAPSSDPQENGEVSKILVTGLN